MQWYIYMVIKSNQRTSVTIKLKSWIFLTHYTQCQYKMFSEDGHSFVEHFYTIEKCNTKREWTNTQFIEWNSIKSDSMNENCVRKGNYLKCKCLCFKKRLVN